MRKIITILLCGLLGFSYWLTIAPSAMAFPLADRVGQYPQWPAKLKPGGTNQDLSYPQWMAGEWEVESTLLAMEAPLAPDYVSPGFDSNQPYLHVPVKFPVRFIPAPTAPRQGLVPTIQDQSPPIISDRQFNGTQIAEAYVGKERLKQVLVEPHNPNNQIAKFSNNQKLTSQVIGRYQQSPSDREFVTAELTQQNFKRGALIYINQVETTTNYALTDGGEILGDQVTAIYLSPQDPNYFIARDRPIALYRYQLTLAKLATVEPE
jgi:hypothetical protein